MDRVVNLCKKYLREAGKLRDAAALVLARTLTRPDFSSHLEDFLKWSVDIIVNSKSDELSEQFLVR